MEDVRISIRLSKEEHKKLKILAIDKNTNIQEMMHNIIMDILGNKQDEKN